MKRKRSDNPSQELEKLEWVDEDILSCGAVRAKITSATKRSGHKLYSVSFFREANERRSAHFRVTDMRDIAWLTESVKYWIQADEAELSKKDDGRSSYAHRKIKP